MVLESRIAEQATGFPPGATAKLIRTLDDVGLPTRTDVSFAEALPFMGRDKKAREGIIRFSLPRDLGVMEEAGGTWATEVAPELIEAVWRATA